jgi:hypothetical protein
MTSHAMARQRVLLQAAPEAKTRSDQAELRTEQVELQSEQAVRISELRYRLIFKAAKRNRPACIADQSLKIGQRCRLTGRKSNKLALIGFYICGLVG